MFCRRPRQQLNEGVHDGKASEARPARLSNNITVTVADAMPNVLGLTSGADVFPEDFHGFGVRHCKCMHTLSRSKASVELGMLNSRLGPIPSIAYTSLLGQVWRPTR